MQSRLGRSPIESAAHRSYADRVAHRGSNPLVRANNLWRSPDCVKSQNETGGPEHCGRPHSPWQKSHDTQPSVVLYQAIRGRTEDGESSPIKDRIGQLDRSSPPSPPKRPWKHYHGTGWLPTMEASGSLGIIWGPQSTLRCKGAYFD